MKRVYQFAIATIAVVLTFSAIIFAVNEWNILHRYAQILGNAWTFSGLILGTGIIVPVMAMLCDMLKERNEKRVDAQVQNNIRDNETKEKVASMSVEQMKAKMDSTYKEG